MKKGTKKILYTPKQKLAAVDKVDSFIKANPGLSQTKACRETGIKYMNYVKWRMALKKARRAVNLGTNFGRTQKSLQSFIQDSSSENESRYSNQGDRLMSGRTGGTQVTMITGSPEDIARVIAARD